MATLTKILKRKYIVLKKENCFCKRSLCQRNLWLEPPPRRKISARQRAKNSEFVWENGGKSVGRASRVPPSGFEKAVEFCFGDPTGNRTRVPTLKEWCPNR